MFHFRRKEPGQANDHEEEFYYTEIDTTVDTVSDTFANMYTSPSSPLHTPTHVASPTATMVTPPPLPEQYPSSADLRPETLCDRLSPPPLHIVENNNNEQQYTVVSRTGHFLLIFARDNFHNWCTCVNFNHEYGCTQTFN